LRAMPYKNDNLEELFQNAAEDYPLKTSNSNWNSVAAKLENTTTGKRSGKNYRFLTYTIFALFLLGGSLVLYKSKFEPQVLINKQTKSNNKESVTSNKQEIQSQKSLTTVNSPVSASSSANNKIVTKINPVSSEKINNKQISDQKNYTYKSNNVESEKLDQQKSTIQNKPVVATNTIIRKENSNQAINISNANSSLPGKKNQNLIANSTTENSASQKIKFRTRTTRFYGTLYGSPEFSTVQFQHLVNPGYQVGVALGYRINNRFDVQIGLQRERINYYTDGKYFDKSGLKLKDAISLESIKSNSKLTSIPITLKYNFLPRNANNNSHFYAVAGVNAIVLTHAENYDYVVSRNGDLLGRSKSYSSVTNPKYFTAINTGAGYETKLSNWCNIKIEPYYQIPISNIGVGNVSVTNFGLNIGIVKNLK
ncbi:MAG TPA: outer membrane beta-barrel protein, partial [Parafilimonas sp.]